MTITTEYDTLKGVRNDLFIIKNKLNMKLSKVQKKWLMSSVVTFVTGFGMVLLANIETITMKSFSDGAIMGVLFMATRAGIKAVLEYFFAK